MTSKYIFQVMYSSNLGYRLAYYLLSVIQFFTLKKYLSDKRVIKLQFKKKQGYDLDFDKVNTLNEKMQWLKLNDRSKLHTICADKFAVRQIFKRKYGEKYLIPLIFTTEHWQDIKFDILPEYPFIIKPNHGSGWYKIIHDRNTVDIKKLQLECRYWLSQNYYNFEREWQYKNIEPKIIIEKLLISKNGNIPTNYRVHCIHGRVEFIALTIYEGGNTDNYKNLKFNRDWEYLDFDWADKNTDLSQIRYSGDYPKPERLDEIITIAEDISKDFKYIRVDFFEFDNEIYHGELTFHDGGGFERITPFEWDLYFGSLINLDVNQSSFSLLND